MTIETPHAGRDISRPARRGELMGAGAAQPRE
jgi:hypothetical protein